MTLLTELSNARYKPKYVVLAEKLLREMAGQDMEPGDRLATENELVERHQLSRVTVRQALEILEKAGYVSRRRARGTFVERRVESTGHLGLSQGTALIVCSNEQHQHREEDSAFATVLRSMEQALSEKGYIVQILSLGLDPKTDRERLTNVVHSSAIRGILTIGSCLEPYRDLIDSDVPVVTSCTFHSDMRPTINDDSRLACRELVAHLIAHGHEDIALISSSTVDGRGFTQFAEGYREVFEQAGLPINRTRMIHAYPKESLKELTISVLSQAPRPTAVFCENWRVSRAVLAAASALDLRVPQDVSLVGYGQNVLEIRDPLTVTAYVPNTRGIGLKAVDVLVRMIDSSGDSSQEQQTLPGHLVEGDSVLRLA